jgi:hypothetical protein
MPAFSASRCYYVVVFWSMVYGNAYGHTQSSTVDRYFENVGESRTVTYKKRSQAWRLVEYIW